MVCKHLANMNTEHLIPSNWKMKYRCIKCKENIIKPKYIILINDIKYGYINYWDYINKENKLIYHTINEENKMIYQKTCIINGLKLVYEYKLDLKDKKQQREIIRKRLPNVLIDVLVTIMLNYLI